MIPRSFLACLGVGALAIAGCAGSTSSASEEAAPLPTIGLGSELTGEVLAGADVRTASNTPIDSVVMIGDSITVASLPALQTLFEQLGFDGISIESQEGKRTSLSFGSNPSGADIANFIVNAADDDEPDESDDNDNDSDDDDRDNESGDDDSGDSGSDDGDRSNELWIVALGTNDINQYADDAEIADAIDVMLDAVPDESPLIWVDVYFEDEPDGAEAINDAIDDRLRDRGNSTIAPWSAVAAGEGNLRNDGVHPREQGTQIFANVIGATIVEFLQL